MAVCVRALLCWVCTKKLGRYAKLGTAGALHSTIANSLTTSYRHLFCWVFTPVLNNPESITATEEESARQIERQKEDGDLEKLRKMEVEQLWTVMPRMTKLYICHGLKLSCSETGLNINKKKLSSMRQKGQDRQAGSKQAGQEYTGQKEDRTKDNNPARDEGKTDTIYRGETGVQHERVTRQEWLRQVQGMKQSRRQEWLTAGEGNETIKTEETLCVSQYAISSVLSSTCVLVDS